MLQVTVLGEICVTNDSVFMFIYPYLNRVLYNHCLKPCGIVLPFYLSFVWNSSSQLSTVFSCYIMSIILFLHSVSMSFCLSAYILRLNALQCSQDGQFLPSP